MLEYLFTINRNIKSLISIYDLYCVKKYSWKFIPIQHLLISVIKFIVS